MIGTPLVDESDWIATDSRTLDLSRYTSFDASRLSSEIATYFGLLYGQFFGFLDASGPLLAYLVLLAVAVGSAFSFGTKFFQHPGLGSLYLISLFQQLLGLIFLNTKQKKTKKLGIYLAACLYLLNTLRYSYTDLAC